MDQANLVRTCPACGIQNRTTSKFCRSCGASLPEQGVQSFPPQAQPSPDQQPTILPASLPPDQPTVVAPSVPTPPPDSDLPTLVQPRQDAVTAKLPAIPPASLPNADAPTLVQPALPAGADAPTMAAPATPLPTPAMPLPPDQQPTIVVPPAAAPAPAIRLPLDQQPTTPLMVDDQPTATLPVQPAPVARPVGRQRLLLGGCLLGIVLFGVGSWLVFRLFNGVVPPARATVTPVAGAQTVEPVASVEPTRRAPPTSRPAPTATTGADFGVLRTAQAEQAATATAEAQQAPQPSPSIEPESTATPETDLVSANFTEAEAQEFRQLHDDQVKLYQRLLFEDFQSGNRTKARWNHGTDGRVLRNNRYELTITEPAFANLDLWKQQPALGDTYTVEAAVRFLSLDRFARAGIVFDMQDNVEQKWYYLMGNDGFWYVFRDNELVGSGRLPEKYEIRADVDYSLWVWRLPNGLAFFFNAELVAFATDSVLDQRYQSGKVGIVAASGPDPDSLPITVVIDNLLVAAP